MIDLIYFGVIFLSVFNCGVCLILFKTYTKEVNWFTSKQLEIIKLSSEYVDKVDEIIKLKRMEASKK